jgi:cytosine/adenosine deaminase-related metal-dependent hydrolase/ubiquinone/menaquinone biosynthesis C-methylase UbiE
LGAPIHQSPQAEGRKPLIRASVGVSELRPAPRVSAKDGYRLVSAVYDTEPNPMLSLEQRFLERLLPPLQGLDVVDLGCGTGRWLARLAEKEPRSLVGVDLSSEMLFQAKRKLHGAANLVLADCCNIPFPRSSADLILCSFLESYIQDFATFAQQIRRLLRPGGAVFLSDLHPRTVAALSWRRGFNVKGRFVDIATYSRPIEEALRHFQALEIEAEVVLEPQFGDPEAVVFQRAGKTDALEAASGLPAIYILQLRVKRQHSLLRRERAIAKTLVNVRGARVALGPQESTQANIKIEDGRVAVLVSKDAYLPRRRRQGKRSVDLTGFLVIPGLVNAHDHLEFALFPRLGRGGYQNFVEWAEDIHHPEASPVREHRSVGKDVRLWWGGIRNLLCGVTTVCHHNPYVDHVFDKDFAVRVQRDFSWAHSIHLEQAVAEKQKCAPGGQPFILHLAEGIDAQSAGEIFRLAEREILNDRTVIVHGLGLDQPGFALLRSAGAALIWCPTSNMFLFGRTHNRETLESLPHLALGSDSPLTAAGDLLEEVRFAAETVGVPVEPLYSLVTTQSAQVLRLKSGEGTLRCGAMADFIAVRDTGQSPAGRLATLSYRDVEFVVIGGRVQLVSARLLDRLPHLVTTGLRALEIESEVRWIRAPLGRLFNEARKHLPGEVKLGGRTVRHGLPA